MVFETVFWFSFLSLWDNNLINSPGTALSTLFFSKTTLRTTSGSGFWDVDSIWVKMITVLGMSSLKIYNFFAIQQIFVICNSYNPCHLKPSYLGFSMGQSEKKKRLWGSQTKYDSSYNTACGGLDSDYIWVCKWSFSDRPKKCWKFMLTVGLLFHRA